MLRRLLGSIWRNATGKSGGPSSSNAAEAEASVRTLLENFLHSPLAHPKTIDYEMVAQFMAAASSADYMVSRMKGAMNLVKREDLLEFALDQCTVEGLVMEFGVYRGASLRAIARRVGHEVHGFDSFEGLPHDWTYYQKQGRFSLQGQVPGFDEPNVRIHRGLFADTLPDFLSGHPGPARFVHVDCDIYESTRTVMELTGPRLVRGSVVVFDEYLNYPGWRDHEFRAFQEFVERNRRAYRYLGFASSNSAVAVVIE